MMFWICVGSIAFALALGAFIAFWAAAYNNRPVADYSMEQPEKKTAWELLQQTRLYRREAHSKERLAAAKRDRPNDFQPSSPGRVTATDDFIWQYPFFTHGDSISTDISSSHSVDTGSSYSDFSSSGGDFGSSDCGGCDGGGGGGGD